jgi:glutamate transport system ATP-binding protein
MGRSADGNIVEIESLRKRFGSHTVLDGIDLAIGQGEAVVVAGPSGSGKSTLLRCINGLETVDEGEIRFDGRSVPNAGKTIHALRAKIGMVFQAFNLFPHRTVLENITLGPIRVREITRAQAEARARELLARVGIPEKAEAFPADLSGGQQQRVAIARALAMDPKLMLFDEPTSALDPEMIKEVLDVMVGLASEGTTMVVVSHEMGFARSAARRVAFMDEGRIVELAPPDRFFSHPETGRARDFLSKILAH